VQLGGEIVDLQRLLPLDGVSPLLLANVLGVTTRLREELTPEATSLPLESADALPESGAIWLAGELIRYGRKNGSDLVELQRGLLRDQGFADGKEPIAPGNLALDFRCVLAAAWPFFGRADQSRRQREPFAAVADLADVGRGGFGGFSADEIDQLQRVFAVDTMAATAATWGRPERVFNELVAARDKTLLVKSALHVGAGSTVRLRNLRDGTIEYGLVMRASTLQGQTELRLPSVFELELLWPVAQPFPAADTTVEPLIPAPVNVNTAAVEVLAALCAELRQSGQVRTADPNGRRRAAPRALRAGDAQQFATQLEQLRAEDGEDGHGPFTGWQDFVKRALQPRLDAATGDAERQMWLSVYRGLQTGRDSVLEMGTGPITFQSGPWVAYRAAASRTRSQAALGVVARHERSGIAAAIPGFRVQQRWNSQDRFEEAFLLDRRAPFWLTMPINLGHLQPGEIGNDPAPRYFPHLVPVAYPSLGLGAPRYPVTEAADSGIQPAPSTTRPGPWAPNLPRIGGFTSFAEAIDWRGHDIAKAGPFTFENNGPSVPGSGNSGAGNQGGQNQTGAAPRHDVVTFPFADPSSFVTRFALNFWLQPQALGVGTLFEHGDGEADRNRIALLARDGNLVLEVTDEAGVDPDPSQSPAGITRTASEWNVPLADLVLPPNTPLHVSMSAFSGKPADLSLAIDGMTRGQPKFVTYLAAPLSTFDPTLANNRTAPNQPGNERYLDLAVESTDGFPPVGVLRIGLELFEYSAINGNSFRCRYTDSVGGRGSRQVGREHRPSIPVDQNGEPTVDINSPQFQGVNLDFFPAHPAGAMVELYGYSAVLSEDSLLTPQSTQLDGAIGAFSVARAFVTNPRDITISIPNTPVSFPLGRGIDEQWVGDIELADPVPTGQSQPPNAASNDIANGFAPTGGYALLMQYPFDFSGQLNPAQPSVTSRTGGIELIRYTSRNGTRLTGVQRAQQLPGDAAQLDARRFDGTARRFLTDYAEYRVDPNDNNSPLFDEVPNFILWVVPISISVQNASAVPDPAVSLLTEWVQLFDASNQVDTEWVRYDTIAQGKYLCRANRAAWDSLFFELIRTRAAQQVRVGPLGSQDPVPGSAAQPWGTVAASAGFIGYVPQLESTWPQIHVARRALRHRGDMMLDFFGDSGQFATSSHPQNNSLVLPCHRLQLLWGNYGALTGRCGRHDRVALVRGSQASGSQRANVEWHTVNWAARRFDSDNLQQNQTPPERLGPWPFQLVAFQAGVQSPLLGPPAGTVINEVRQFDRIVKFPSGELPAAYCPAPTVGAGLGNQQSIPGHVDEIDVVQHLARDLVLDEPCTAAAQTFTLQRNYAVNPAGTEWSQADLSVAFPLTGGLVAIDGEILAYQSHAAGVFTVATNGRGLLNTQARDHDRGARVRFLTHRPAAILNASVSVRDAELPVQSMGALPSRYGTVLLGQELLHYTWARVVGDRAQLEMPRWYPPDGDRASSQSRGLFRGRYGTAAQGGSSGEAVIGFPFRYWDRHVERCDDPELGYFQLTTNEAPVLFRTLQWREETTDPRVEVSCYVRADGKQGWQQEPAPGTGLWRFRGGTAESVGHRLDYHGTRLEVRFVTAYKAGAVDLASFRAHGWKTTARIEDVRLEYEGQSRIFDERVTTR
jgi:hypothetical protein